jgi:aerobic carbon-monoxide dehydrogenase large subunit
VNEVTGSDSFDAAKFGVGQPVSRKEDPILLRGEGRYSDDISAEGQVYLEMVRSPVAQPGAAGACRL